MGRLEYESTNYDMTHMFILHAQEWLVSVYKKLHCQMHRLLHEDKFMKTKTLACDKM